MPNIFYVVKTMLAQLHQQIHGLGTTMIMEIFMCLGACQLEKTQ